MRRRHEVITAILLLAGLFSACGGDPARSESSAVGVRGRGAAASPDGVEDGRPRRALLVGVSRYHPASQVAREGSRVFEHLEGPANDLALIRKLLCDRFGFAPDDIRELEDGQATLENVVRAFHEHLIEGVTSETEVVFWYCGHGSRVVDQSGEEVGGDSTFVLYDSRLPGLKAPRDLDDDALHALLNACPSERITVVTDSCHSGTVTRSGGGAVARSVGPIASPPNHAEWEFWSESLPILDDDDGGRQEPSWLHIAACGDAQQAHEQAIGPEDGGNGNVYGLLSFYLCERLRRATPGTPWDAVIEDVRFRLRRQGMQRPEREGSGGRTLFGDPMMEAMRGFPAFARKRDSVLIEAGALQGLGAGAVCDVFRLENREKVGRVLVDRVESQYANATWHEGPHGAVPRDTALLAVVHNPGALRRTLLLDRSSLEGLDQDTRRAIEGVAWLFPVDPEQDAALYRFRKSEAGLVLTSADGFQVWPRMGDSEDLEALAMDVQREARFQWLWSLAGRRNGELSADVVLVTERSEPVDELVLNPSGGPTDVMLSCGPERGAACTVVLDLAQSTRRIQSIWPRFVARASQKSSRLRNHLVTVNPSGAAVQPLRDPGLHRVLVVSTRSSLDLSMFLDRGERMRGTEDGTLFDLLPQGWGVSGCEVRVRER